MEDSSRQNKNPLEQTAREDNTSFSSRPAFCFEAAIFGSSLVQAVQEVRVRGPWHPQQARNWSDMTLTYPLKLQGLGKLIFYRHIAHVTPKKLKSSVFKR